MELKQSLEGDDVGDIRAKTEALQEASHKLAEAVYASAQQQTASSSATGNGDAAGGSDDEVVEEGDYEVIDEEQRRRRDRRFEASALKRRRSLLSATADQWRGLGGTGRFPRCPSLRPSASTSRLSAPSATSSSTGSSGSRRSSTTSASGAPASRPRSSERANERLVKELIPVLDDLGRALEAAEQHEEAKLEDGVRLVHRALATLLAKEGLAEIETERQVRPARPRGAALAAVRCRRKARVIEVVQKGYTLGDKVLRPARVVVAAPMETPEA